MNLSLLLGSPIFPVLADEKFKEWVCSNYQFSAAVAGNLIDGVVDDGHE